jgi:hypothetical protein
MTDAQKAINVAVEWANEMGVEFSVEKTVVMRFTNKRSSSYQMSKGLKIYGQEIPVSKTTKYLGVTLDDKLSWKPNIENKIKKAKRTLMAIRSVIGKSWGPSPKCAKWSLTGVIWPALTYGAIVWSRTASQSWAKKKLQRLQRMAPSQIAGVRPSIPSAALSQLLWPSTSSGPGCGRRTLMRLLMKMSGRRTIQSRFPQKTLTYYPAAT